MTAALIRKLESTVAPSRVLDFELHLACIGDPIWPATDMRGRVTDPNSRMSDYLRAYRDVIDLDDQDFDIPRYTVSIDAALLLVPEDWRKDIWLKRHGGHHWSCVLHIPSRQREGRHMLAALAVCIAASEAVRHDRG